MEKKFKLILLFIFFIGLYERLSGTLNGYFAFTFDQGRDFLILNDLVYNKIIHLTGPPTGMDGVFHGVWWHWGLAPIFWFFQGDPKLVVATFNFFSSFLIFLVYYFGIKLLNQQLGIIFAAITSVSPFFISISSQLWHPSVIPILMVLLLIAFWNFLNQRSSFFWVGLLLGLIFEFEIGFAGLFIPVFLLMLVLTNKIPKRKELFFSTIGFSIWLIPRIIFDLRNNFIQARSFIKYLNTTSTIDIPIWQRLIDRCQTFFRLFKDTFFVGDKFLAVILLIFSFLMIAKFYKMKTKTRLHSFFTCELVLLVLLLLGASLYPDTLWTYYLIGLPSLLLPLVGYAIYLFIQRQHFLGWLIVIFIFLYDLFPLVTRGHYWEGDASVYRNQLEVVSEVFQEANANDFNYQVYSPSVIDYTYNYLFLWYGKKYFGFIPSRDQIKNQVFLIIEPDKWRPVLQEIWLRERDGDGKIVWQKNFPGNISVQKKLR